MELLSSLFKYIHSVIVYDIVSSVGIRYDSGTGDIIIPSEMIYLKTFIWGSENKP